MLRKVFFWAHLAAGFIAGVFVLIMSVTGALLTYESQIVDAAVARAIEPPEGAAPLDSDALVAATLAAGTEPGQSLILSRDNTAPAKLQAGRESVALDPYTGAALEDAGAGTQAFFSKVTSLHRWLSLTGRSETGGAVNAAANLLFLFLVASGLYLWLPPVFRWTRLRMQLFFRRGLPSAQARHYNWHHVFGVWALIPLFLITLSGVVISYPWASNLVYTAVGESAPQGRGRPGGASALPQELQAQTLAGEALSYATLLDKAAEIVPDWRRATVVLPQDSAAYLQVTMDSGNGVRPAAKTELVLNRASGEVMSAQSAIPGTLGARLRYWFRFVHTGQIYGLIGQTVAGLASVAAAILVYTGFSLGLRRLARMWRRRRPASV